MEQNENEEPAHSRKAKTMEEVVVPISVTRAVTAIFGLQITTVVALVGVISYSFGMCNQEEPKTKHFLGGIILATIFLLSAFVIAAACTTYYQRSQTAIIAIFFALLMACLILVQDVLIAKCIATTVTANDNFCFKFLSSTNVCDLLTKKPSNSTNYTASLQSASITIDVLLIILTLLLSFFFVCYTKIGKPVYLSRKHHTSSIVVGEAGNVNLAHANLQENRELTDTSDEEEAWYNGRKSSNTKGNASVAGTASRLTKSKMKSKIERSTKSSSTVSHSTSKRQHSSKIASVKVTSKDTKSSKSTVPPNPQKETTKSNKLTIPPKEPKTASKISKLPNVASVVKK